MIPSLSQNIIEENLHSLYRYPAGNFVVSDNGQLSRISDYNLIGRFVKWFKDIISGGEVTKKVHLYTLKTFVGTLKLLNQNKFLTMHVPGAGPVGKGGQWEWCEGYDFITARYVKIVASDEPLKSRDDINMIVDQIMQKFDWSNYDEKREWNFGSPSYAFVPVEDKLKITIKEPLSAPKSHFALGGGGIRGTDEDL